MHRSSGPRTTVDASRAPRGGVLVRGSRLIAHGREEGSMRAAAELRRRFEPLGRVRLAPLVPGTDEIDLTSLRAVAVVLPHQRAGGLVEALNAAVALVERASSELRPFDVRGASAEVGLEEAFVVVAGPGALLEHRRVRPVLATSGTLVWRTDRIRPAPAASDRAEPDPVQRLVEHLMGCGVVDLPTLVAVRRGLEARRHRLDGDGTGDGTGDPDDGARVLDELRHEVPGLHGMEDVRWFHQAVRVVHDHVLLHGPARWPRRHDDAPEARSG